MGRQLHSLVLTITCALSGLLVTCVLSPHIADILEEEFAGSSYPTSLIYVCFVISFAVTAPVAGLFVSVHGIQLASLLGAALTITGLLTTSFAHNVLHVLCTYSVIAGVGSGLVFICIYEVIKDTFSVWRNVVFGIVGCFSYASVFILHPFLGILVQTYHWRGAVLIFTGVTLNLVPLLLLLASAKRNEEHTYPLNQHHRYSILPNRPIVHMKKRRNVMTGFRVKVGQRSDDKVALWTGGSLESLSVNSRVATIAKIIRKTGFYALLFVGIICTIGSSIAAEQIRKHASSRGLSESCSEILLITGVSVCVVKIVQGCFLDKLKLNPVNIYMTCAIIGGATTLLLIIQVPVPLLYVYTGVLGTLLAGTGREVTAAILINLSGEDNFGFPFGMYVCVTSLAGTIGPPVAEWIETKASSHKPVFAVAAASMTLAGIALFLVRRKLRRKTYKTEDTRTYKRQTSSSDDSWMELVTSV